VKFSATRMILAAVAIAATVAGCNPLQTPVAACPPGQHWTATPGGQQPLGSWKCVNS
jgi:hypothetical protein